MNCRQFVDFIMDYLESNLDTPTHQLFEEHLRRCPSCVDYLNSYQQSIELGMTVCRCEEDDTCESMPEQLVQAILAARRQTP